MLALYDGCTNPLVVQRTLAARSVADGQRGALLAAALKLTTLVPIVAAGLPGGVLYPHLRRDDDIYRYIRLALGLLPSGVPGAFLATCLAALMAARSATYNSAVTVLSIDFIPRARPQRDERHTTRWARITTARATRVSAAGVPQLARFPSLRQYFQAVHACLAPPVAAVFLAGVLWRGANARGAFGAALYVLALLGISRLQLLGVTGMDLAVSLAARALASLPRTPRSVQLGGLAVLALTATIVAAFWSRMSMAAIKDVAKRAGVGVGTVLRVIAGSGSVSADAPGRVRRAVEELRFRPSHAARVLQKGQSQTIGVFVPLVHGAIYTPILHAIYTTLRTYSRHMVVDFGQRRESERQDALDAAEFLTDRGCDGLLIMGTALKCTDVERIAALRQAGLIVPGDLPVMGYDGIDLTALTVPPLITVLIPWRQIASHALHHLLNLCYGISLPVERDSPAQVTWRDAIARLA